MSELTCGGGGGRPFGIGGYAIDQSYTSTTTQYYGLNGTLDTAGNGGMCRSEQSILYGGGGGAVGEGGGSAVSAAGPYSGPRVGGAGGPAFNGSQANLVILNTGNIFGRVW